jgi:2-polyprenyl-3-methyl-5-hydroxy-6-metoxy-1,4-benzoquinol methylase
MHYEVDGLVIRSENAAKPPSQPSKWVMDWIRGLPRGARVLDYGCGKLRYTIPLSRRVRTVVAVDSAQQVSRTQLINKKRTTLVDYVSAKLVNVEVYEVDQGGWQREYDRILVANVLSAIPNLAQRIKLLQKLATLVSTKGQLLACNQYRNTYFRDFETNPRAHWRRDGWLVRLSETTASFYAIIPPDKLEALCQKSGLQVSDLYVRGESAYAVCERPS